jgi:hypothetical protein
MAFFPPEDNTQDVSGLPSNDAMAQLELQRRLRIAQQLQQTKAPEGQMISGHYVAPSFTQQLASAYGMYKGRKAEEEALKGYGEYTKSKETKMADALKKLGGAFEPRTVTNTTMQATDVPLTEGMNVSTSPFGTTDQVSQVAPKFGMNMPAPQNMAGTTTQMNPVTSTSTVQPSLVDIEKAFGQYASDVKDPKMLASILTGKYEKMLKGKEPIKLGAGDVLLDPNTNQPLYTAPNKADIGSLQKDYEYAKSQGFAGGIEDWKKVIQQPPAAFYQALPTAQGYAQFNARTGQIAPLPLQGQSVLPAAQSPALQGEIAGARMGSEAQAKRAFNMTGAGSVIDQAENILTGQTKPTASGIGALADVAGSVVGYAPRGAAQADQLKAIGGQLVSKMPRMEGPQSDRDVQLYTQMAGQIGDATIPISRRLAALQTVRSIVQKYEPMNQPSQSPQQNAQPNQPKTIRFEDLQ